MSTARDNFRAFAVGRAPHGLVRQLVGLGAYQGHPFRVTYGAVGASDRIVHCFETTDRRSGASRAMLLDIAARARRLGKKDIAREYLTMLRRFRGAIA